MENWGRFEMALWAGHLDHVMDPWADHLVHRLDRDSEGRHRGLEMVESWGLEREVTGSHSNHLLHHR
jgi:hypothetical protein